MPSFDARVIQQPGCTKRRLAGNEAEGQSAAKRPFLERETFEPITSSGVRRRKYPTISLANNVEAVKKIQAILDLVAMSLLAIPFMEEKKERSERERPESISEVRKKLERGCYKKTDEVLLDLENIFSAENKEDQEMNLFIGAEECQRKFVISGEEREQWGKKLRQDLSKWVETTFVDEAAFQQPVHSKILNALTRRFPHVSQDQLKVRSCQVAEGKDTEKLKSVLQKVNDVNANNTPGVADKKYRFFPSSKQHEFDDEEHLVHESIAGYQFHKMISKWSDPASSIPVPLRTVSNPSDAIAHIDYIKNSKLEKIFEAQKERFLQENKDVKEVLLFHGTSASCVESILKTNSRIDHLPVQQTSQNAVRDKKMMFGRGVYFSEIPAVSLMYGTGLTLCKVLLGNCQDYRPVGSGEQPDIPEGFDSRQVVTKDGSSVIHVARNTSQILPYCVIQLKNDAISSDYRKPCPTLPAVHLDRGNLLHQVISNDHLLKGLGVIERDLFAPPDEAEKHSMDYTFLNILGAQICYLWTEDTLCSNLPNLSSYLLALLAFTRHPSQSVSHMANRLCSKFFRHRDIGPHPVLLAYITKCLVVFWRAVKVLLHFIFYCYSPLSRLA